MLLPRFQRVAPLLPELCAHIHRSAQEPREQLIAIFTCQHPHASCGAIKAARGIQAARYVEYYLLGGWDAREVQLAHPHDTRIGRILILVEIVVSVKSLELFGTDQPQEI